MKDWPKDYAPPRDAKTADKVFPHEYGVNAKRVLARTNSEKCAQEAKWIRDLVKHVEEEHNPTVPADRQLFVSKCFESSEADVCVTLKGQETRLANEHKSLDIRCKKKHWVGLQVMCFIVCIALISHYDSIFSRVHNQKVRFDCH